MAPAWAEHRRGPLEGCVLIPDLTLTPGLAERLRACGDEEVLEVAERDGGIEIRRGQCAELRETFAPEIIELWSRLSEHEQRRVEGVLAAHRAEPF